jgi:hypothetical protein
VERDVGLSALGRIFLSAEGTAVKKEAMEPRSEAGFSFPFLPAFFFSGAVDTLGGGGALE